MDINKAFSFPFQTTRWAEKLLVPALLTLIPIFGQIFLVGWYLDITRRVEHGEPDPLPEIDIARQLADGIKGMVISLVYALPNLILGSIALISINSASNSTSFVRTGVTLLTLLLVGLMLLYALAMLFVLPAALGHFVAQEDVAAAFRFNEVFGLLRNAPGDYGVVLLITLLTSLIAPLGGIFCGIGAAATTLYAMAINGYLYGEAYRRARVKAWPVA